MCVFATSIWLSEGRIFEAMEIPSEKPGTMVLGLGRYPHPISRRLEKQESGYLMVQSQNSNVRTQDEVDSYFDAGYLTLASAKTWLQRERIFDYPIETLELERHESIDIDTASDLEYARTVFGSIENG